MDIHGYEPPWKALSEFAMHQNLDRMDPSGPQFQHLVGQVSLETIGQFKVLKFMVKMQQMLKKQTGFVCVYLFFALSLRSYSRTILTGVISW